MFQPHQSWSVYNFKLAVTSPCILLDAWSKLTCYQSTDTRRLVFKVPLCRWFETQTFKLFTGISEFYVTCQMDKTQQEAGSWALNPALVASVNSWWCYFFKLSDLIADRGQWYFQVCQGHSALWELWKPPELWVLTLKVKINRLVVSVSSVCILTPVCYTTPTKCIHRCTHAQQLPDCLDITVNLRFPFTVRRRDTGLPNGVFFYFWGWDIQICTYQRNLKAKKAYFYCTLCNAIGGQHLGLKAMDTTVYLQKILSA